MKTKIFIAMLALGLFSATTINAQEKEVSKKAHELTHVVQQKYACPMHADIKSENPGKCSICKMELKKVEIKKKSEKIKHKHLEKSYYTCPMHADIKSDTAGECPKCHMALVEKKIKKDDLKKNN